MKNKYNLLNKKEQEYDCLRVIATIFVVLGHCTYYKISTSYGGIDYSIYADNGCIMLKCFIRITKVLYLFHMPLFMALSGALFYKSVQKKRYDTFLQLIKNKGKKLLIPFLVVSTLYSFPLKLVSGYYFYSTNLMKDFLIGQLLIQGNTHLWYLVTLFFIFVLAYEIEKHFKGFEFIKILLFVLLNLISVGISIKLLSNILYYILWFYVGFYFEPNRILLNKKINICACLYMLCMIIGIYFFYHISVLSGILFLKNIFTLLIAGAFCLLTYMLAYIISKTTVVETYLYKELRRDSFGIYLYSDSWNYVILFIGYLVVGKNMFMNNIYATILYIVRFFGTLVISILVTKLVEKCNLKYFY